MNRISDSQLLNVVTKLLILVLVAKAISLAVLWYMPSDGVELNAKPNYQPAYQRVDFRNMLDSASQNVQQNTTASTTNDGFTGTKITNMVLKGLYGNEKNGYAIVALKSSPKKTEILGFGDVYKGYKLKAISVNTAVFEKGGKDFVLQLENMKKSVTYTKSAPVTTYDTSSDEPKLVNRNDINYYAKNPKEIWKDISIKEVKRDGKIAGFKVTKIKPNSKFAALGLERGDLIIKANNVKLESYKDALDIYNKIDKINALELVVIRNNQEREIVYEVH